MDKISVIVPVYNVAPFIVQCLSSIREQTYRDLEIILVDDGSTDDSGKICDGFSSVDKRFKVLHQENKGVSSARNVGIDLASGRYIAFADPDDYLSPNFYEVLYTTIIEYCADLAVSGLKLIGEEGDAFYTPERGCRKVYEEDRAILDWILEGLSNSAAWDKLYSRELWGSTRFPVGLSLNEDIAAVTDVCVRARRVVNVPEAIYCYRIRNNSLINSTIPPKRLYESLKGLEISRQKLLERFPEESQRIDSHASLLNIFAFADGLTSSKKIQNTRKVNSSALYRLYSYIEDFIRLKP